MPDKKSHHHHQTSRSLNLRSVSSAEAMEALEQWGKGLISIAKAYSEKRDHVSVARSVLDRSYAYADTQVLFKPTLATKPMFRETFESALSYFIGGNPDFAEDRGFALTPWTHVEFDIAGIVSGKSHAIVMGNKILTRNDGHVLIVNFTMGFTRLPTGALKINVHHSSLPYAST
jgi:hypothetical protein